MSKQKFFYCQLSRVLLLNGSNTLIYHSHQRDHGYDRYFCEKIAVKDCVFLNFIYLLKQITWEGTFDQSFGDEDKGV